MANCRDLIAGQTTVLIYIRATQFMSNNDDINELDDNKMFMVVGSSKCFIFTTRSYIATVFFYSTACRLASAPQIESRCCVSLFYFFVLLLLPLPRATFHLLDPCLYLVVAVAGRPGTRTCLYIEIEASVREFAFLKVNGR